MADVRIISRTDGNQVLTRLFVDGKELTHVRAFTLSCDADHQPEPRLLVEFCACEVAIEADTCEVVPAPLPPPPR